MIPNSTFKLKALLHSERMKLFYLWLFWAATLLIFQYWVVARIQLIGVDAVLDWTLGSKSPQLLTPPTNQFYKFQATLAHAWDSVFYISIAEYGYHDRAMPTTITATGEQIPISYAFPPLYPLLIRVSKTILQSLGISWAWALWLSAVGVSLLGALAGLWALPALISSAARPLALPPSALLVATALLCFPSSFFMAQMYSEGLFVGCSLWALVLMQRQQWLRAALLVSAAFLTRTVGLGLIPALLFSIGQEGWQLFQKQGLPTWRQCGRWLLALGVLTAVVIWWYNSRFGVNYFLVEKLHFNRQMRPINMLFENIQVVLWHWGENPATDAYYLLEFGSVLLAVGACLWALRYYPQAALFGLAMVALPLSTSIPQGLMRYTLTVFPIFLLAGYLSRKSHLFSIGWQFANVLLLAVLLMLFSFDWWVG